MASSRFLCVCGRSSLFVCSVAYSGVFDPSQICVNLWNVYFCLLFHSSHIHICCVHAFLYLYLLQELTEEEVCCSIIGSLVSSEDKILDARSFTRATSVGQTGGATRLEETLVSLLSDPAHHSERESVLHTLAWKKKNRKESFAMDIFESHILELSDTEEDRTDAPTPLHAVGTWKQPSSSSKASQVRLLDAAIHSFAATFGLQDGRAQDRASRALGSLLPATLLQSARSLTVTASSLITENEKQKPRVSIMHSIVTSTGTCV